MRPKKVLGTRTDEAKESVRNKDTDVKFSKWIETMQHKYITNYSHFAGTEDRIVIETSKPKTPSKRCFKVKFMFYRKHNFNDVQ
jgi:hypothetical protein